VSIAALVVGVLCARLAYTAEAPMIVPSGATAAPLYSVEQSPLNGGSELVTIFRNPGAGAAAVPLVTVLRDTLGDADPENDRLTYVWLLNNARPAWWQRIAAATPFFYHRAAGRKKDRLELAPLIDVSAKRPKVWSDLGQISLQIWTFDPAGLVLRASTRAYQGNLQNEQRASFEQALAVLGAFEEQPGAAGVFSSSELERLRARLLLGQRRFGGLAPESRFSQLSANDLREEEEARGLNWEILRQAAESNGLWFDPVSLGRREPNYALIWIRRSDLTGSGKRPFDTQFLRIADPWKDARLPNWNGYERDDMIPLALYDLEYPRAPLLLVDFRDNLKPKKREIFQRSVTDLMKSVFGLSYLRDWYCFATRGAHDFVAGRHGAALDPLGRLRAYARLKLELGLDHKLDRQLRRELQKQLGHLALNPLESNFETEARIAEEHYSMLRRSAQTTKALVTRIDRDRSAELRPALHSAGARLLLRAGAVATLGIYRHRERVDADTLAVLDVRRRTEFHERFLQKVADSSRVEVDWDREEVRRSLDFLVTNKPGGPGADLLGRIFARTQDEDLRLICLNLLREQRDSGAGRELAQLARLDQIDDHWRRVCLEYASDVAHAMRARTSSGGPPASSAHTTWSTAGAGFALLPH
jgi:hypothetical protein